MLHAQYFSYIQIWYTHPFVYRVYVYMTNFEREAYNKRTTQYVLYFSFSFIQKKKQKSDTFFQNWKFQNLNYATIWNPGLFFFWFMDHMVGEVKWVKNKIISGKKSRKSLVNVLFNNTCNSLVIIFSLVCASALSRLQMQ